MFLFAVLVPVKVILSDYEQQANVSEPVVLVL